MHGVRAPPASARCQAPFFGVRARHATRAIRGSGSPRNQLWIRADHRFLTGIENGYERMNSEETAAPRPFFVVLRVLLVRHSLFEPPRELIVRLRGLLGKRNACRVKAPRSHVRCRALRSADNCSNSNFQPPRSQRSQRLVSAGSNRAAGISTKCLTAVDR